MRDSGDLAEYVSQESSYRHARIFRVLIGLFGLHRRLFAAKQSVAASRATAERRDAGPAEVPIPICKAAADHVYHTPQLHGNLHPTHRWPRAAGGLDLFRRWVVRHDGLGWYAWQRDG